jgi:hypothetical protein
MCGSFVTRGIPLAALGRRETGRAVEGRRQCRGRDSLNCGSRELSGDPTTAPAWSQRGDGKAGRARAKTWSDNREGIRTTEALRVWNDDAGISRSVRTQAAHARSRERQDGRAMISRRGTRSADLFAACSASATHMLLVAQLRQWLDAPARNPADVIKKQKLCSRRTCSMRRKRPTGNGANR